MATVTILDDQRPHITIPGDSGDVYVVPLELMRDIVAGKKLLSDIDDSEQITRAIVREWLGMAGNIEG